MRMREYRCLDAPGSCGNGGADGEVAELEGQLVAVVVSRVDVH
jgi:hypothetical protein